MGMRSFVCAVLVGCLMLLSCTLKAALSKLSTIVLLINAACCLVLSLLDEALDRDSRHRPEKPQRCGGRIQSSLEPMPATCRLCMARRELTNLQSSACYFFDLLRHVSTRLPLIRIGGTNYACCNQIHHHRDTGRVRLAGR